MAAKVSAGVAREWKVPKRTLRGMALGTCDAPKSPVKVTACSEIRHGARAVEAVKRAEKGEGGHGTVDEARIGLAECIACEYTRGLL